MSLTELFMVESDTVSLGGLFESIYDPHVLKAVFLAGSGGSGKGAVSSAMFAGVGLKVIDQDQHLVRFMHDAGQPLSQVGSRYDLMKKAQKLKGKELRHYAQRRMGIIIDSTGWDYERIATPFKKLEQLGYDCSMVYVHTKLDTALRRNKERAAKGGRNVPDSYITTAWEGARRNFEKYVTLFGKTNIFVIDNDKDVEPKTWTSIVAPKLRKIARKILDKPLRNPKGKEWLEKQKTSPDLDSPDRPEEWPEEPTMADYFVTYTDKPPKGGKGKGTGHGQGRLFPVTPKKPKAPPPPAATSGKKKQKLPAPKLEQPPVPKPSSSEKVVTTGNISVTFGKKPSILSKLGGIFKPKNEATLEELFAGIPLEEKDWRDNPKDFRTRLQITPEKADPSHSVASIGKSAKDGKWYGWSHRAYAGFGRGDKPYFHVPVRWDTDRSFDDTQREYDAKLQDLQDKAGPIKNDDEARASAVAYAQYVS